MLSYLEKAFSLSSTYSTEQNPLLTGEEGEKSRNPVCNTEPSYLEQIIPLQSSNKQTKQLFPQHVIIEGTISWL